MNKHTILAENVKEKFLENNFSVETEVKLPNGKGSVDIVAKKRDSKIYVEIKSNPQSVNSKKVQKQLGKYQNFFGNKNIYCLISPNSVGHPRICSLDRKINCNLTDYLIKQ